MTSKPFHQLEAELPPEAIADAKVKAKRMLSEIRLQEIRKKRGLTQAQMAQRLNVQQAYISKLEGRSDFSLSKFRQYIAALGGSPEIVIHFPDEDPLYLPL